jgi:hypothetical protein
MTRNQSGKDPAREEGRVLRFFTRDQRRLGEYPGISYDPGFVRSPTKMKYLY